MEIKDAGIIEKTVLKKTYEESHIEWRIPDFLPDAETRDSLIYFSPSFFVYDVSCFLKLYSKTAPTESTIMYLYKKAKLEYCIEYEFSLKNSDGIMQKLVSGILQGNRTFSETQDLIQFSELLQKKSKLIPNDVLTLVCKLKREINHSNQPNTLDKTIPMKLIRLDKLSENFKDLFNDEETSDVTLKVKGKEYKAHRSVLIARSSVFAATFKHDTLERRTGVVTISDCDPDSFREFLEYLYSGKLEELSAHSALSLYYTSNKYDVEELKAFCVEYLMQSLTLETICEIAVFASRYDETQLLNAVQDFFNKNFLQIFLTSEWKHLLENDSQLVNKLLEEMAKTKLKE